MAIVRNGSSVTVCQHEAEEVMANISRGQVGWLHKVVIKDIVPAFRVRRSMKSFH